MDASAFPTPPAQRLCERGLQGSGSKAGTTPDGKVHWPVTCGPKEQRAGRSENENPKGKQKMENTETNTTTETTLPKTVVTATRDLNLVVTARDRELICLISIARYLSTEQANRLVRPGRHESVGRRRLIALAGILPTPHTGRPRQRGVPQVFSPQFLRRVRFRKASGERVDLWALEPRGHALAFDFLGSARKFSKSDVGEHFLEHWATLTQLFVELAAPFLERGTKAAELPFRWEPNDTNGLPWQQYDMEAGKMRARRIIPDAVLELPQAKKRFFIECEMGTHSIVATSDEKAGATLAKTERYDEFLASRGSEPSFYRQAFADGWPSEVLYLVRKDSRAHSINRALETWRKGRGTCVRARAGTLPEAVA
jgi:hypothetical protein